MLAIAECLLIGRNMGWRSCPAKDDSKYRAYISESIKECCDGNINERLFARKLAARAGDKKGIEYHEKPLVHRFHPVMFLTNRISEEYISLVEEHKPEKRASRFDDIMLTRNDSKTEIFSAGSEFFHYMIGENKRKRVELFFGH